MVEGTNPGYVGAAVVFLGIAVVAILSRRGKSGSEVTQPAQPAPAPAPAPVPGPTTPRASVTRVTELPKGPWPFFLKDERAGIQAPPTPQDTWLVNQIHLGPARADVKALNEDFSVHIDSSKFDWYLPRGGGAGVHVQYEPSTPWPLVSPDGSIGLDLVFSMPRAEATAGSDVQINTFGYAHDAKSKRAVSWSILMSHDDPRPNPPNIQHDTWVQFFSSEIGNNDFVSITPDSSERVPFAPTEARRVTYYWDPAKFIEAVRRANAERGNLPELSEDPLDWRVTVMTAGIEVIVPPGERVDVDLRISSISVVRVRQE